ncbi:hypothetical protein [Actinoplanes sp. NPDC023714]|uniref:hypothetical protein n=1 Tax=Actinoplanes sp. NPDC023714 TaxID=3154322 RepID=UPI00340A5978
MTPVTGLFARPDAAGHIRLDHEPVLESWNAADHPDQLRLRSYLAGVTKQLLVAEWANNGPRAIELVVGLPDDTPLDRGGRDLDNYLYPLVRHFGGERIGAAFARKAHQEESTIAVVPAENVAGPAEEPQLTVRTSMSATSAAWKGVIHAACARAVTGPLPPGPVGVRLQFGVSAARNWAALWKPAIDALGPVLGMPQPAQPFRPDDDRIVDLQLHRIIDDALGHDVIVRAWWWPTRSREPGAECS